MMVDLGGKVITKDDKDFGAITRFVLDSSTKTVNLAIVEHGLILTDAYEVPFSAFIDSDNDQIRVNLTLEEAHELPRFDGSRYSQPPPAMTAPFGFPVAGLLWPVADPVAAVPFGQGVYPAVPQNVPPESVDLMPTEVNERLDTRRKAEQDNAVIERGSDVFSSDGEKVGEVDSLSFDSRTGQPTRILVRHGGLFSEDVEVPGEAIESVDDGVINLKADKEQIELWSRDNTVLLF